MKKKLGFFKVFVMILVSSFMFSCIDYPEFDSESSSELILKSASGFSSELGEFYVQRSVSTVLYLESSNYDVMSATWKIEDESLEGKQIVYTFNSISSYDIEVEAVLSSGAIVNKTFTVNCVLDLSENDPVKSFVISNENNKWQLLFLFSKERLSDSDGEYYHYIGTMTDWKKVKVASGDENYIINSEGNPERLSDVGNYLGVNFEIDNTSIEHEIAIVLDNDNWVNLSGSSYVRSDNVTKAVFYFDSVSGEIIPQGDYISQSIPGTSGDMYLRFELNSDELIVYFRLEDNYSNKSFCTYKQDDGTFSNYIELDSTNFSNWGSSSFDIDEVKGKILDLRYGKDYSNDDKYSKNMSKSSFYSKYFKSLRLSLVKVE